MYINCMCIVHLVFSHLFITYSIIVSSTLSLPYCYVCVRELRNLVISSCEEESALQLSEPYICNYY